MSHVKKLRKESIVKFSSIVFLVVFVFLFLGFYRNQWNVVRDKKFSLFQKDVEAYVIARMVLTRQSTLSSNGGLLGWGDVDPKDVNEDDYQYQYETYLNGGTFQTYLTKESHPGFQGIFFSILDRVSPMSPSNNLRLFRGMTAGLFAFVLTGIIIWFAFETGWLPAFFVFISILVSQWMTLFGRNLFFVSGLFYLPMLLLLFQLRSETQDGKGLSQKRLFWLVFLAILLKCLFNGYDFILPTLAMVASPIVFYGVKDGWAFRDFTRRFLLVVLASLAAILASLFVLSIQEMFASGSFMDGVSYILETLNRRTLSNDPNLPSIYARAKNASTWSILQIYLSESYLSEYYVPYFVPVILFAVISGFQIMVEKKRAAHNLSYPLVGRAIIVSTWFGFLGPLSWYVIFKSVAYFHTHMNYLPWHMPFTLFGFDLCGYFIQSLFGLFHQYRKTSP